MYTPEQQRERNRELHKLYRNKPDVKRRAAKKMAEYRKTHKEQSHAYRIKVWRNNKITILTHYSGSSTPLCACCGEAHIEFLTVDHIHNDGAKHRKEIGHGSLYTWIIKNNFPTGMFQVLCLNCNAARYRYGVCPHQKEKNNVLS